MSCEVNFISSCSGSPRKASVPCLVRLFTSAVLSSSSRLSFLSSTFSPLLLSPEDSVPVCNAISAVQVLSTIDYRCWDCRFTMSPRGVAVSNQNYLSRSETTVNDGIRRWELHPSIWNEQSVHPILSCFQFTLCKWWRLQSEPWVVKLSKREDGQVWLLRKAVHWFIPHDTFWNWPWTVV